MAITLTEAQAYARRNFFIHLAVYLGVNAILLAVNLLFSPDKLWFYWPLAGWGAGILLHAIGVFVTGGAALRIQLRRGWQDALKEGASKEDSSK